MTDSSDQARACLFGGQQLAWNERRCSAFALAGVVAHAGCCGGCATNPVSRVRPPGDQPAATP
jgi:hypothetical protein